MQEFTLDPLTKSRLAPGGRQLIGQAAGLTLESTWGLLEAEHSPITTYQP